MSFLIVMPAKNTILIENEHLIMLMLTDHRSTVGVKCYSLLEIDRLLFLTSSGIRKILFTKLPFEIIPNGKGSAENFGMLKASLEKSGSRLDDFDLTIASCALAPNLTLVTNNTKRHPHWAFDVERWMSDVLFFDPINDATKFLIRSEWKLATTDMAEP